MNQAGLESKPIGDNFWFVFFAYFLAIATWSLLSSHDFLSSSWETVARTRKRGRQHLVVVSLPMIYMCAYMYWQYQIKDYKEFNAALVALGFAILHMARTIVGLWQLHIFKQWAVSSIMSMDSLRRRAGVTAGGEDIAKSLQRRESIEERKRRVNGEADSILVNESVVDNRLLEGDVRCYVRLFTEEQENAIANAANGLKRVLLVLVYAVTSAARMVGIVWPLVFSMSSAFATPKSGPYLVPVHPEELYLRWSMVLVSRAFPEWVAEVKTERFAEVAKQGAGQRTLRDRFAALVLYSAALHTERLCEKVTNKETSEETMGNGQVGNDQYQRKRGHRLLPYEQWHKFPKLCNGKFCKDEFLAYACSTGAGLPFAAAHPLAKTQGENDVSYGYSRFRSKLDRARDSLPADEAEKVTDFDVEALEWLAVCLSVPDWDANVSKNIVDKVEEPCANGAPVVSVNEAKKSLDENSGSECGMRSDIAIKNLANQLGFDFDSKPFLERFSNPFLRGAEDYILWGNRNVLQASVHVDNWLALCAGEQMAYMVSKIPGMEIGAVIRKLENSSVREECVRMEKLRFMFQISVVDPEHSYYDQSLSFMGVSMENLRSMLAVWVENHGQAYSDPWTSSIKLESSKDSEMEDERDVEFTASEDFESLLNEIRSEEFFSMRFVQMRLLWELQNKLRSVLHENGSSPKRTASLILCLLSFPALCFEAKRKESHSDVEGANAGRNRLCCVKIEEEEKVEFDIAEYIVGVKAVLSPQVVRVDVSFSTASESGIVVTARLYSEDAEGIFKWELWRDAFEGSLEGIRSGREQHGFQSPPVLRSKRGISAGICDIDTSNSGTGSNMKTWAGWLPWNPAICKYELMSDGFVLQRKNVHVIDNSVVLHRENRTYDVAVPQLEYEAAQYDIASPSALQHASMVSHDFLRREGGSTAFRLEGVNTNPEDICGRAERILKGGTKADTSAALILYEIAASERGDTYALAKAIDMQATEQNGAEGEERALELLERFYLSDFGRQMSTGRSKSLHNRFQDAEWVAFVRSQYKILIDRTRGRAKAVISYASFCILLYNFTEEIALEDGIRVISNALMRDLHPKWSYSALRLRGWLMRLMRSRTKEKHFLGCTVYENLIQYLDSERKQVPCTTIKTRAMRNLAVLLINGAEGVQADAPRAVELYRRAIKEGADVPAMYNLALLLMNGAEGVPADASRAAELYRSAIEEGADAPSMYNLALLLENGAEGVPADAPRAAELYSLAIDEGAHIPSMYNLAVLLKNGSEGVPADASRAAELYSRAIEEGADVSSMYNLALLLINGDQGVAPDVPRAAELYGRAIDEGAHVPSMNNLAILLMSGAKGVSVDIPRAAELYSRAIDEGAHVPSMYNLAFLLENGSEGVRADAPRAVELYSRAVEEAAHIPSMYNLAVLLINGAEGVQADAPRAAELYTRGIEEGADVPSMYNLALLLMNGAEGVPADIPRAEELYSRAIDEGAHVPSKNNLVVLLENGAEGVTGDERRVAELVAPP